MSTLSRLVAVVAWSRLQDAHLRVDYLINLYRQHQLRVPVRLLERHDAIERLIIAWQVFYQSLRLDEAAAVLGEDPTPLYRVSAGYARSEWQ